MLACRPVEAQQDPLDTLTEALRAVGDGLLVVITGAGVSAASGIPTFRGTDPDAVWNKDVTELATRGYFEADPVGSWSWYLKRFASLEGARPNDAHRALVDLEHWQRGRGGDFLLVTQNIDTLHEQAGSEALVKVHGSSDRLRCSHQGCRAGAPGGSLGRAEGYLRDFAAAPGPETLPRCPECGGLLRPHVLWFDEHYLEHRDYGFRRVEDALRTMDLALFVGTSFSVGITEMALQAGLGRRVPMLSIDPAHQVRLPWLTSLDAEAEALLPSAGRRLGATAA